ncbi:MAG: GNAT family N-acetyltransferase [Rhodothermales bacterium]
MLSFPRYCKTGGSLGACRLREESPYFNGGSMSKDVDVGFAFLPAFWLKGYAFESVAAVIAYERRTLGLRRIVAVTQPDNVGSIKTLEKAGLTFEGMVRLSEEGPALQLFASDV